MKGSAKYAGPFGLFWLKLCTALGVIVEQATGLHPGINNGWSAEFKPCLFQIFGDLGRKCRLRWHVFMAGKVEKIAVIAIFRPFLIDFKIFYRGLDFDNNNFAFVVYAHQISTSPVGQCQLGQQGDVVLQEKPGRSTLYHQGQI
mgnify:CR=1 FL=1